MESLLALGIGLLTIGYGGKKLLLMNAQNYKKVIPTAMMKHYFKGGFNSSMNKGEATLILNVRASDAADKIKDAHRKLMLQNHPDSGGSTYIASKINEAKEVLLKSTK